MMVQIRSIDDDDDDDDNIRMYLNINDVTFCEFNSLVPKFTLFFWTILSLSIYNCGYSYVFILIIGFRNIYAIGITHN